MICPSCGTENEPSRAFCGECGAKLALVCASCGGANTPGTKFCGDCGAALAGRGSDPCSEPPRPGGGKTARLRALRRPRRVHDALGEPRPGGGPGTPGAVLRQCPTDHRPLRRHRGEVHRRRGDGGVGRAGGPGGRRRAGRSGGLDLSTRWRSARGGVPGLRMRVGVVTGEVGGHAGRGGPGHGGGRSGQHGVAGPVRREAGNSCAGGRHHAGVAEAAIDYEGGSATSSRARPRRFSCGAPSGRRRRAAVMAASPGLEAPFVGRDRELRLVKELFHTTWRRGRRVLVSVVGVAGIGKSRLAWEFEKYVDGLVDDIWWHRGRCLAYGEGVAYWALAEMVRRRSGILEDEAPASARRSSRSTVEQVRRRPGGASLGRAALAHLLGLAERAAPDQQDLFAAWRLLLRAAGGRWTGRSWCSRICSGRTPALLDFVEYLLEWSRDHPLFVLTLGRPELLERRPSWAPAGGASARSSSNRSPRRRARSSSTGGARAARGPPRPDPGARGRRAALRGGDGPDAARPWACCARGGQLPGHGIR